MQHNTKQSRRDPDTFNKSSVEYAVAALKSGGFLETSIISPPGYGRPLAIGSKDASMEDASTGAIDGNQRDEHFAVCFFLRASRSKTCTQTDAASPERTKYMKNARPSIFEVRIKASYQIDKHGGAPDLPIY